MQQTCVLCRETKALESFDLNETRKRRLKTCQVCNTAIRALPAVTADGHLCTNCACYKQLDQFEPPTGRLVCVSCRRGPNFGAVGVPSVVAASVAVAAPPVFVTTSNQQQGLLMLLEQLGAQQQRLQSMDQELVHFKAAAESSKAQVDMLRDLNSRILDEKSEFQQQLDSLYDRIEELKLKAMKAESRALTAEASLAGASKVVGAAVPEGVAADEAPILLKRFDRLNVHVREAAFHGIAEIQSKRARPVTTLIEWIDDAIEKMRFAVKDPVFQGEVLKLIFEIHASPRTRGEIVKQDRFALGPKSYKARKGRYRVFYTVSEVGEAVITEVVGRADAYTHGTVAARKTANRF